MKLPNGYGSVVKYKGNRRRPFMVRKTIGFNEKGHPVYKVLGWAATREEGYKMLADFNHEPWNTDLANITFADLYTMWRDQHESTLTKSTRGYVSAAYAHSASLYSMKYKSIRSYHFQNAIDSCAKSYATKAGLRTLYRKLDRYAFELDIISKRYSDLITLPPKDTKEKQMFTENEIDTLWQISSADPTAATALILIYTGWRISELLGMKNKDIDLEAATMKGGSKTAAGKDRIVPIHHRILPLVEAMLKDREDPDSKNTHTLYVAFLRKWQELMFNLGMEHTIHETRHTFRSRLDSADANQYCTDLLMGHSAGGVRRIYTHKTLDELRKTIELLK